MGNVQSLSHSKWECKSYNMDTEIYKENLYKQGDSPDDIGINLENVVEDFRSGNPSNSHNHAQYRR